MKHSAIILAGGLSKRFQRREKSFVLLAGKPLIRHVIDRVSGVVDEVIVVIGEKAQQSHYESVLGRKVAVILDKYEKHSPIVGALSGLEKANGDYSIILPCDTPFISKNAVLLFFDLCPSNDAVIPKWPEGQIEPLQAVYSTKKALRAAKRAFREGKMDMKSIVDGLQKVLYVSTTVICQFDPELNTFFNVNTLADVQKAETILKKTRVFR